ncbi:nucleotidyltransferase family protein [Nocardioides euryhalodurans]|uniref:Nucleotidyltransferase family protein n=1 Tax=Nocardioides euryhalodurans TaxID=2518370 RepID=A0A4P7GMS6_9ACTN|nr:nucleotidyltransferase family protein [Nocardioides euryhalodurans]QBR93475.1 nucleotidyltransferase family protein [Nocardioides euryhalodurans]
MTVEGLLLAAGSGSRMGRPKALVRDDDGTAWLARSARTLLVGGCDAVTVVLGAGAEDAAQLVPPGPVTTVVADDWAEGMGASLRTGLGALAGSAGDVAVVSLVDLPDVGPEVVRRLLATAPGPAGLARAAYDGVPGHPVLLGRDHWSAILAEAAGDAGARSYLGRHDVVLVECGDLATGRDVDRPPAP